MWKAAEGSTKKLIYLCWWYFFFYVITGVTVKYFQYYPEGPQLSVIQYLTYGTLGGVSIALIVVFALRWYRFNSARLISFGKFSFPSEFLYIAPAGFCTAVIVPATTLLYSIKGVSVMVAMVLMRGSVIITGRIVDEIQIRQGILHKKVYMQENMGVLFAILAVCMNLLWVKPGDFDFLTHYGALTIFLAYITAYAFRIYIMNYFKNTRPKHIKYDSKSYFAIEQIFMACFLVIAAIVLFYLPQGWGGAVTQIQEYRNAIVNASPVWYWAILAGTAFGMVAFFSVFIFMYKGRTATFAGLVNRLTSLIAGTAATLVFWLFFQGKFPEFQDWLSLVFILVAIAFMSAAEKKRTKELVATHELSKA